MLLINEIVVELTSLLNKSEFHPQPAQKAHEEQTDACVRIHAVETRFETLLHLGLIATRAFGLKRI